MDYGYSTTSYGAQGPAGGGGFMNMGSQEGQNAAKTRTKDSLRPVTIKQINDATQAHADSDSWQISGAETTQLTFVGQIQNISHQALNTIYRFDDGTGSIEVKQWTDPDSQAAVESGHMSDLQAKLKENSYARVFGTIKSFGNKKHVGARGGGIRPVTDFNEVQYHLLEATAVHLHFTRGPLDGLKDAQNSGSTQTNGLSNGDNPLPPSLSNTAKRMYGCLKNSQQTNEGLHVQDISSRLHVDTAEIFKAGEELILNGMAYTTVDDETWAILESI